MKRFVPVITLTAICWVVFLINNVVLGGRLLEYGIVPRHVSSLPGILWAPFLHGSLAHITANTIPLFVLGAIISARGKPEFMLVTTLGILLTGLVTWLFARPAVHVGASGLIFCYFGYLASLAWFNRTFGTLLLSLACLVAYGGILRGIFPADPHISWESHAAGLITGITLAWFTAKLKNTPLDSRTA
jgi:membrane associated rhomboid family serine protease